MVSTLYNGKIMVSTNGINFNREDGRNLSVASAEILSVDENYLLNDTIRFIPLTIIQDTISILIREKYGIYLQIDDNFPVVFDFPAGHGEKNFPMILGREIELIVSKESADIKFYD